MGWGRGRRQENQTTATVLARDTEGLTRTVTEGTKRRGIAKRFLGEHHQGLGEGKNEEEKKK